MSEPSEDAAAGDPSGEAAPSEAGSPDPVSPVGETASGDASALPEESDGARKEAEA